jgi:hypothetical protein
VLGSHIQATDGTTGHLDDLLIDDRSWGIRYIRIDTSNGIGGKAVLIPRAALKDVSWSDAQILVGMTRQHVYDSPEFDSNRIDEQSEAALDRYYGLRM